MDSHFRTLVNAKDFPFKITFKSNIMLLGSCFAENIGSMLKERKFIALINPFGTLYNPTSVSIVLNRINEGNKYNADELGYYAKKWFSFHHHTLFSDENKEECLSRINNSLVTAHNFYRKVDYLILTFGTARVYYYIKTGEAVANCHKIPSGEFESRMLTIEEIVELWASVIRSQISSNPQLKIILTVSPVRHWKDGATGNQVSKATLIIAMNKLAEMFEGCVFYFPAYEIMMDDLRDYRFYADDMLHPSNLAVNYIWEQFKQAAIDPAAISLSVEIEKVMKAMNHKPFKRMSKEYNLFIESTIKKIEEIIRIDGSIDFSEELDILAKQLQ